MKLSKYVKEIIRAPNDVYTPSSLDVSKQLADKFRSLLNKSESDVKEYGKNLYWKPSTSGPAVTAGQTTYDGGAAAVNLQTSTECKQFSYIGDFHTHPYKNKYGPDAKIGPSNGDWMEWWHNPPQQKDFGVHCVASGNELFVIIFRSKPTGDITETGVTGDAGRLNDFMREELALDVSIVYGDALQRKDWPGLRKFFSEHAPNAIQWHEDDTNSMNRELAEANGCEYYRGPLSENPTRISLISKRVRGNWFTARTWASGSDPWF